MSLNLVTTYPIWFALLCLLLGVAYAMTLYFREKKHELPVRLVRILALMRFLVVSFLGFFLLSPLLETISRSTEKPVIIVGQDNSASLMSGDSAYYKTQYLDQLREVISNLSRDYDVRLYRVGEGTEAIEAGEVDTSSFQFDARLSDLSSFFREIDIVYSNRNVGAVVFASDGNFNKGISPEYAAKSLTYPIYTIALGDTSIRRDLILKRLNYNRIAFKGNEFPIEVQLNANKFLSRSAVVYIMHQGNTIARKTVRIDSDRYSTTLLFTVEASGTGLQRFRVGIMPVEDEINTRNNYMDCYIEVLEAKQKILILANSPHPDISSIKQALGDNYNYEVEDLLISEFTGSFTAYNLLILHQLPSFNPNSVRLINDLQQSGIPVWYIIGGQTDLGTFNGLKTGLTISSRGSSRLNEAQAAFNETFVLFNMSDDGIASFRSLPPLNAPFGEYRMISSADVLFYQKIGSVTTEQPLLMINRTLDKKIAVTSGEGIWKWRIAEYARKGNHENFNELIDKMVQYLSIQEDKRRFRVEVPQTVFENDHVVFSASLYNESYELVNEPDVAMSISSTDGNQYDFVFNKYRDSYILDAGGFPLGDYEYFAEAELGMDVFTDAGGFTIIPLEIERSNTVADHNLLFRLAESGNGLMLNDDELQRIPDLIRAREDVKPVVYMQKRFTDLINLPWIFGLLIALLGLEWFFRKYAGSY